MSKTSKGHGRHLPSLEFEHGLTPEVLCDLYLKYQPIGSGPLGTMRMVCALIEEIASAHGIELPPAQGVIQPLGFKRKAPREDSTVTRVFRVVSRQLGVHLPDVVGSLKLSDIEADSLDRVELVMAIEDEFQIVINDEESDNLVLINDLIDVVNAKKRMQETPVTSTSSRTSK